MREPTQSLEAEPSNPPTLLSHGRSRAQRLDLVAWVLLIGISSFLLIAIALVVYLMDSRDDKAVVCVQGAGQVLAVTPTGGLASDVLVETTLGFYAVTGGIGLAKGEELTLQTQGNRRRHLCDASQRCMPLR